MSIITDALNRLQSVRENLVRPTGAHTSTPTESTSPESQASELNKTRQEPTYDKKFLTISLGSFLVIATMAMGAYWWGESIVSDVSIVAMPRSAQADHSSDPLINTQVDLLETDQEPLPAPETGIESGPEKATPMVGEKQIHEVVSGPNVSEENVKPESVKRESVMPKPAKPESVKPEPVQTKKVRVAVKDSADSSLASEPDVSSIRHMESEQETTSRIDSNRKELATFSPEIMNNAQEVKKDSSASIASPSVKKKVLLTHSALPASVGLEEKSQLDSSQLVTNDESGQKPQSNDLQTSAKSPSVVAKNPRPLSDTDDALMHNSAPKERVADVQPQTWLSPEQRLVKAQMLIERQSHAEAIELLYPLFKIPPSTWEPWFWLGTAQFGVGDLDKAEDSFMEGLVRDDTVPYLWVQRAVIAQQRGQYPQAMDALRQAALLDPKLPEVQLNLAYNLEHQGNPKLARRHYQQYLSLTEGKSTYHAVRRKVLDRVIDLSRF